MDWEKFRILFGLFIRTVVVLFILGLIFDYDDVVRYPYGRIIMILVISGLFVMYHWFRNFRKV